MLEDGLHDDHLAALRVVGPAGARARHAPGGRLRKRSLGGAIAFASGAARRYLTAPLGVAAVLVGKGLGTAGKR